MKKRDERGFTIPELTIVMFIAVCVAAVAVPTYLNSVRMAKLRGAATDFSGILQTARIRAIQDDKFYSVYISATNAQLVYVDIYPIRTNGTYGNGGTQMDPQDPAVPIASNIAPIAAANAPGTSGLKGLFLPTGSTLPVHDASLSSSPITFGPRGLPCTTQSATGGTVCDSAGGATAFWIFFQDSRTQQWGAITVSPAGRIQKWGYNSSWQKVA